MPSRGCPSLAAAVAEASGCVDGEDDGPGMPVCAPRRITLCGCGGGVGGRAEVHAEPEVWAWLGGVTVGFHNFNLRTFNSRSPHPNKLIVDVFLTMSEFNVPRSRPEKIL